MEIKTHYFIKNWNGDYFRGDLSEDRYDVAWTDFSNAERFTKKETVLWAASSLMSKWKESLYIETLEFLD